MKAIRIPLSAIVCSAVLLYLSSCGNDDPGPGQTGQTKEEEVTALLVGKTWKVQSVTVDGVDRTSMFTGLALSFTASSVTATNPGPVWTGVTSWIFTSADAVAFRRNDAIDVQVDATATTLKLTLVWNTTTLGPGRAGSVKGTHVFNFGL